MQFFWVLMINFKNAWTGPPICEFLFSHPFEYMRQEWFSHCPAIYIVCVEMCDVFCWLVWIICVFQIWIVCFSIACRIIETPLRIPFSIISSISGSEGNSNFTLLSFRAASHASSGAVYHQAGSSL